MLVPRFDFSGFPVCSCCPDNGVNKAHYVKEKREAMIEKILTISDSDSQDYVENARKAWQLHGFELVSIKSEIPLTLSVVWKYHDYIVTNTQ